MDVFKAYVDDFYTYAKQLGLTDCAAPVMEEGYVVFLGVGYGGRGQKALMQALYSIETDVMAQIDGMELLYVDSDIHKGKLPSIPKIIRYDYNSTMIEVLYYNAIKTKELSITDEYSHAQEIKLLSRLSNSIGFQSINCVVLHSASRKLKDGLGIAYMLYTDEHARYVDGGSPFMQQAEIVVFVLDAMRLFSSEERLFIAENYAGVCRRNVFFVVNRIDGLSEGQLESFVMPMVQKGLREVFADANGTFDEELYKKRVFYTNAYGAMCVRKGKPYTIWMGRKEVELDIEMEDTRILELEESLSECKDAVKQQKLLIHMKQLYTNALKTQSPAAQPAASFGHARRCESNVDQSPISKMRECLDACSRMACLHL